MSMVGLDRVALLYALHTFILIFLPGHQHGLAQTIENVRAVPKGDLIEIHYDLKPGMDSLSCNISVYASHNQFSTPLLWVSGHVGQLIPPGDNKMITWEARKELENFKGELIIEVQADPVVPPYVFLTRKPKARIGKKYSLSWQGGRRTDMVDLQLLNAKKEVVTVISSFPNERNYTWTIPNTLSKNTYYFRLLAPGMEATSQPIRFYKNKKWWIAIPIAGAVILGINLLSGKQEQLPLPPAPPENN